MRRQPVIILRFAARRTVVNVYNRSMNGTARQSTGDPHAGVSGVIMDQRGYIITSKHVINVPISIVALQDGRVF